MIPTLRPDAVVDPDYAGFRDNVASLVTVGGVSTQTTGNMIAVHN